MKQCYPKKFLLFLLLYKMSTKAIAQTLACKNVKISAGDYVTAHVFNHIQINLLYARTDAGSAYRWNATSGNPGTAYRFYGAR